MVAHLPAEGLWWPSVFVAARFDGGKRPREHVNVMVENERNKPRLYQLSERRLWLY